MRFLVVGNGPLAKSALAAILAHGGTEIGAFFTRDKKGASAWTFASGHAISIRPEAELRSGRAAAEVQALAPDWLLSANSTTILGAPILAAAGLRALNLHPGPLPQYAGLHTHQWAIRNGEQTFGVTLHFMQPGIDTGDIVATRAFPIQPDDTGLSLFQRCMKEGGQLLAGVINDLCAARPLPRRPQDLSRQRLYRDAEARSSALDWDWTARQIRDFVRAGNYRPFTSPTYTPTLPTAEGDAIHILACQPAAYRPAATPGTIVAIAGGLLVACGDGTVRIADAVRGGRAMTDDDWRRYADSLPLSTTPPPCGEGLGWGSLRPAGRT